MLKLGRLASRLLEELAHKTLTGRMAYMTCRRLITKYFPVDGMEWQNMNVCKEPSTRRPRPAIQRQTEKEKRITMCRKHLGNTRITRRSICRGQKTAARHKRALKRALALVRVSLYTHEGQLRYSKPLDSGACVAPGRRTSTGEALSKAAALQTCRSIDTRRCQWSSANSALEALVRRSFLNVPVQIPIIDIIQSSDVHTPPL